MVRGSSGDLRNYTTEPVAKRLAKAYPDVAAKVFRALGMRTLKAKKSRHYDAALGSFEDAKKCFERAGLARRWDALVAEVLAGSRKRGNLDRRVRDGQQGVVTA